MRQRVRSIAQPDYRAQRQRNVASVFRRSCQVDEGQCTVKGRFAGPKLANIDNRNGRHHDWFRGMEWLFSDMSAAISPSFANPIRVPMAIRAMAIISTNRQFCAASDCSMARKC
jgi:hypothetical protein